MEKGEPSLVPEWLRSTGSGTGAGCLSPHFASSQTDGPVLALPKRNRSSKSIGNIDSPHSPLGERSSSSSRRNSSSIGSSKHDKNPFSRSYSGLNRNQCDKDNERLTIAENWDLEYSDPLRSLISGRSEDALGRSQSMISRRQGEILQRRVSTELRNGSHSSRDSGRNGSLLGGSNVTGIQKVSFERDFPVLGGSEERPKTPDIIRVSSPGLSRGIQTLSIGNSTFGGSDSWTSALAEVPTGVGSNSTGSPPPLQSPPCASASSPHLTSGARSTLSGLNMAEALVQTPSRPLTPQSSAQLQRDELAVAQSKKLIPVIPSLPKALVNSSDKLKPKTAVRPNEVMVASKNGVHQLSPLQISSQSVRGTSTRVEAPKSPSGRLLLLKPGRENGLSTVLKDSQSQITNVNNKLVNGQSTGAPSLASVPLKNPSNSKLSSGERKVSGLGNGNIADKRNLQSRSDFFNLMRKKSINNTSGSTDSENVASPDMTNKSDKELKELGHAKGTSVGTENELKYNGEGCAVAESSSHSEDDDVAVYPNEEEKAFLRSLGWDENSGDDEGLTEDEINAFYQDVLKMRATSKLCHELWPKILSHVELHGAATTEPGASASQTEA